MRSLVRWSILLACLLFLQVSAITAATPQAVQVQGVLEDENANPLPDGPQSLILTGWDDSTGGALLWTQNQVVSTRLGRFQCFIESPAAAAILANSGQQYIQVQVAGEAPLLPRIRLGSVPSALLTTRMDGDIFTQPGELVMRPPAGDPGFDLLRITAVDSTASISIGDPNFDLLRITADNSGGSIAIDEEGVQRMLIHSDSASAGIAIDEPGVHLSIDCREMTTGLDVEYRIGNDLDGDGVPDGTGIAVEEEGIQRLLASAGGGAATISLNGLPPGSPVGGLITMGADSTGGSIAIDEEGVQVVRIQSGTSGGSGGGGGGGGGSIAIGEEGVQIVRCEADSGSARIIAGKGIGDGDMVTSCDASGARTRYLRSSTCGKSQLEFGTDGMTIQCTPGGSTTPDTAAHLDRDGNMAMVGDLSVGGDICAVGIIGACSDARYKTDITTLEGALASLERVRGVNFNWRTGEFPEKGFRTDRDLGFIAQELKEVIPQVVTLGKDGYYSVDYGRLTPLLVEAIKELDAKTRRIAELEARLSSLEDLRDNEHTLLALRLARLESLLAATGATADAAAASK